MEKPQEHTGRSFENHSPKEKIVLVIDDNDDHLGLSKTILELDDYHVYTAQSANAALSILAKIDRPDLILLDMQMADISGPEFLLMLEKRQPQIVENVPIVFLTAMDKVPLSRAMGFIKKPIDIDSFLASVHRFIEIGADRIRCN